MMAVVELRERVRYLYAYGTIIWIATVLVSGRVRGSQEQRLDRTVERSKKRESERTKRKGENPPKLFRFQPLIFIYVIKFSIG